MVPALQIWIDFETGRNLRYTVYRDTLYRIVAWSKRNQLYFPFSMPPLAVTQSQHFTEKAISQPGMLGHYMVNLQMSWP